jgi:hypothetical protein
VSNHLAIAAVTATLQIRLQGVLTNVVGFNGAKVSLARPGTAGAFEEGVPGVHLFLYMVTPNAALRNADLPTRNAEGGVTTRPTAALELHYLLSFVGTETEHEPQRMLGAVVADFHSRPVLRPEEIVAAVDAGILSGSRLEQQIDRVRLIPAAIDLEEFSKLWSVLLQTSYLLSVAYKASVVLVESETQVRSPARVRSRGVYSSPLPPAIVSVSPQIVQAGARLVLRGAGFVSTSTRVRFVRQIGGGDPLEVLPSLLLDDRLEVELPPDLPTGFTSIQVLTTHELASGDLPPRVFDLESGLVPFLFAPRVVKATNNPPASPKTLVEIKGKIGKTVTIAAVPPIAAGQEVFVLIGPVRVHVPAADQQSVASKLTKLSFKIPDDTALVENESYPLRVEVDRAVALIEEDGTSFKPRLTVEP